MVDEDPVQSGRDRRTNRDAFASAWRSVDCHSATRNVVLWMKGNGGGTGDEGDRVAALAHEMGVRDW